MGELLMFQQKINDLITWIQIKPILIIKVKLTNTNKHVVGNTKYEKHVLFRIDVNDNNIHISTNYNKNSKPQL